MLLKPALFARQNLLKNGRFDSGVVAPWEIKFAGILSIVNSTLRVSANGALAGRAHQGVSGLEVGAEYEFAADLVGLNAGNTGAIFVTTAANGSTAGQIGNNSFGTTSKRLSVTFVAPASTLYFEMLCQSTGAGAYVDYDNATLRKTTPYVPPPPVKKLSLQISFASDTAAAAPANWNRFASVANQAVPVGLKLDNLIQSDGSASTVGIEVVNAFEGPGGLGAQTGNNSGIVPDGALIGYFYSQKLQGDATSGAVKLKNLDPAKTYRLRGVPSRAGSGTRVTTLTIQGVAQTLNAWGNTANEMNFASVSPNAQGEILVMVSRGPDSAQDTFGYINSLKVDEN